MSPLQIPTSVVWPRPPSLFKFEIGVQLTVLHWLRICRKVQPSELNHFSDSLTTEGSGQITADVLVREKVRYLRTPRSYVPYDGENVEW